jgi:hypothetical protein
MVPARRAEKSNCAFANYWVPKEPVVVQRLLPKILLLVVVVVVDPFPYASRQTNLLLPIAETAILLLLLLLVAIVVPHEMTNHQHYWKWWFDCESNDGQPPCRNPTTRRTLLEQSQEYLWCGWAMSSRKMYEHVVVVVFFFFVSMME